MILPLDRRYREPVAALCIDCECYEARTDAGRCDACAREWRRADDEAADAAEMADALAWTPADLSEREEARLVAEMTHSRAAASAQESA